jgi:hypothetical protein
VRPVFTDEACQALNAGVDCAPLDAFGRAAFGSITTAGEPRVVQLAARAQF